MAALAAVIAASIAAMVAFRSIRAQRENLVLQMDAQRQIAAKASRASVVSANRQKWIDALREDLAAFIAADMVLLEDCGVDEDELTASEKTRHVERVHAAKLTRDLMRRRIQLRLNPKKQSHKRLYRAVTDLIPATGKDHLATRIRLIRTAQALLRREWLRVKTEAGEWEAINNSGPTGGGALEKNGPAPARKPSPASPSETGNATMEANLAQDD